MTTTARSGEPSATGPLPALAFEVRPSGSHLAIFDLPKLAGGDGSVAPFTLARISVPVGVTTAEDHHEVREIWLIESGSGVLRLDGVERRVRAGESFYYESFHRHQLRNDGDVPIEIVSIWWRP